MTSLPTEIDVFVNQFQSVVNEMATAILRTGHTVFVKETGDFGAALVSPDGEMFAAPSNIGSLRMIGFAPRAAIAASADPGPGDVYLSNDPDATGGMCTHLPDVYMWRPLFSAGRLIAWAWSFVHVSDLGGRVPGSISPSSSDMFQEGLIIPPVKLVHQGELNRDLWSVVAANSRIPSATLGDLEALLAGLSIAERRLGSLCDRRGTEVVEAAVGAVLSYAETHARQLIAALPDGSYEFWDYEEGPVGVDAPIRLRVRLTVRGESLEVDCTGSDPDVLSAFNLATRGTNAHHMVMSGVVNYFRSVRSQIPYNSGMLRTVRTVLPEGSVLNPRPRAAVGVRAATMQRLYDVVLGALSKAVPHAIPAAGSGQSGIATMAVADSGSTGSRVAVLQLLIGGSGGRPGIDGIDGMDVCGGNLRNIPVETIEAELPVRVERYGLLPDSAGAGEFRGGAGIVFEVRCLAAQARLTARGMDRYLFRPWGRLGGRAGTLGRSILNGDHGVGRIDVLHLGYGDLLRFETQGGAGYGSPLRRRPDAVAADVRNGLLDAGAAADVYGVVVRDGDVDTAATTRRRELLGEPAAEFDFGPERDLADATVGDPERSIRAHLLAAATPEVRDFLRDRLAPCADPAELYRRAGDLLAEVGVALPTVVPGEDWLARVSDWLRRGAASEPAEPAATR